MEGSKQQCSWAPLGGESSHSSWRAPSASQLSLFGLFLLSEAVHSVLGCFTGVIITCIHVYLILLMEGVSSVFSYAAAILDLSSHSQLYKFVFQMNYFYSDVGELSSSRFLKIRLYYFFKADSTCQSISDKIIFTSEF